MPNFLSTVHVPVHADVHVLYMQMNIYCTCTCTKRTASSILHTYMYMYCTCTVHVKQHLVIQYRKNYVVHVHVGILNVFLYSLTDTP